MCNQIYGDTSDPTIPPDEAPVIRTHDFLVLIPFVGTVFSPFPNSPSTVSADISLYGFFVFENSFAS